MLQLAFNFLEKQLDRLNSLEVRPAANGLLAWKHGIAVRIVRRPQARRYLLGLQPDGTARLVIPRRGTQAEALRFLDRSEAWLLRRMAQWCSRSASRLAWKDGTRFLFRGEEVTLRVEPEGAGVKLAFADQVIALPAAMSDYRTIVYRCLRARAESELPTRTRDLARQHGVTVQRVTVRGQKSRWGSCSVQGTISLNWRLIQTPPWVADYIIVHELMHRREMNHSARYWKHVERAFPDYRAAEKWLKSSGLDLREE